MIWSTPLLNIGKPRVKRYAKTLFKTDPPKKIKQEISKYTSKKVPHFFIYAKDKESHKVEKRNESVVNKLEKIVNNPRLKFEQIGLSRFDYKMLMSNPDVELDQQIINKYEELDLKKRFMDIIPPDNHYVGDNLHVYKEIKRKILEVNNELVFVVDVLIKYLYQEKKSSYKTTLWSSFGDVIITNLEVNLKRIFGEGVIQCKDCTTRFVPTANNQKYCKHCWKEKQKEWQRKSMKKIRENKKCEVSGIPIKPL